MSATDKREYDFDMGAFDWDSFFYTYVRGGRVQLLISLSFTFLCLHFYLQVYLLKDPMETLPQGRVKYYKLQIAHYTLVTVLILILLKVLMVVYSAIFQRLCASFVSARRDCSKLNYLLLQLQFTSAIKKIKFRCSSNFFVIRCHFM